MASGEDQPADRPGRETPPTVATERPATATATNAAIVYWQAFALLPEPLAEPQKAKSEAVIANPAAPVTVDLAPIVAEFNDLLGGLRRAARVAACDWNLDYGAGAECLLVHLDKARVISKAALLRARLEFAVGKIDEGVADVIAVLKLARDCGSSPLMVSLLVGGVKAEETNSRCQRLLKAVKAKR